MRGWGVVVVVLIFSVIVSGATFAQVEGSPAFEAYEPDDTDQSGEGTGVSIALENQAQIDDDSDDSDDSEASDADESEGAEGSPAFEAYAPDNTVFPGEETGISVTFENQGDIDEEGPDAAEAAVTEARSVTAEMDADDAPIAVRTGTAFLGTVPGGSSTSETFEIVVDGDAEPGTYDVEIDLDYTYTPEIDEAGQPADDETDSESVEVEIEVEEPSQFEIDDAEADVLAGQRGDATVDITNTGPDDASEAVVTLEAPDANVDIPSQSQRVYVGDWDEDDTEEIEFLVELSEDALAQEYTIQATVEYLDENDNERTSRELRTGFETDAEQSFTIDDVQSDLWVGEDGRITGQVTNEGPNTAGNVVVILEDDDQEIDVGGVLEDGGPTIGLGENVHPRETQSSVGTLEPDQIATFDFPLAVSSEAEAGERQIELTVRYRDAGDDVRTSDPIDAGIEINEERDVFGVESGDPEVDEDDTTFDPGETGTLEIAVTNEYDGTLTNIRAQTFTDDPLDIDDDQAFIPELEPGETVVLQFDLDVQDGADPRTYPVEIDFQYDDEDDSDQLSSTYRVPVTVTETEEDDIGLLLLVAGLLVVLVVAGWWFRDELREWFRSLDRR
jgi:hypothetical protein